MQADFRIFYRDAKQVAELKIQHNKECKGLIVQIRYLKAKFIRESTFREDLTWQKEYLLVLLGQFKHSSVFHPSSLLLSRRLTPFS